MPIDLVKNTHVPFIAFGHIAIYTTNIGQRLDHLVYSPLQDVFKAQGVCGRQGPVSMPSMSCSQR